MDAADISPTLSLSFSYSFFRLLSSLLLAQKLRFYSDYAKNLIGLV